MSSCSLLTIHFSLKKTIVASIGIVPISEDCANPVVVGLIVVVRVAVVEVHVPRVVGIVLCTRPEVARVCATSFVSTSSCALWDWQSGDAYGASRWPLSELIQLTPPSLGQTDSRKRYQEPSLAGNPLLALSQRCLLVLCVVAVLQSDS